MLNILYEDSHILVVWKPAGMDSQESRGLGTDMVSEIRKYIHSQSPGSGVPYVGVIHRLDRPVSGILVYARTKEAAAALSRQIAQGGMKKEYLAVLCGKPVDNVDKFVDYLLKDGKSNVSRIVDKGTTGAKQAELSVRVLETRTVDPYGELSLAQITLHTGRHHQIRVQMAGHGLPLWGDQKYHPAVENSRPLPGASSGIPDSGRHTGALADAGNHPENRDAAKGHPYNSSATGNLALAAWKLAFIHPATGKPMTFEKMPDGDIFRRFAFVNKG